MNEDILPDSRTKRTVGRVFSKGLFSTWVPIYCANCAADGGLVPEENMTFAFWLCNNCFETFGKIAGVMMIPDEVFWREVAFEQEEQRRKLDVY